MIENIKNRIDEYYHQFYKKYLITFIIGLVISLSFNYFTEMGNWICITILGIIAIIIIPYILYFFNKKESKVIKEFIDIYGPSFSVAYIMAIPFFTNLLNNYNICCSCTIAFSIILITGVISLMIYIIFKRFSLV